VGCDEAIFSLNKTIDYFTSQGSTVNVCSLDLAKAFDRVDHSLLFNKLMDRKVPKVFIELLKSWYDKSYSKIKWGNSMSNRVKLLAGVRQGGILSPLLFAIFVDDLLVKLSNLRLGCCINGLSFNAIMYADDLILLSISVHELQILVDICVSEFKCLRLEINVGKSACMRIGPRHKIDPQHININLSPMPWKTEIRYLGIHFLSANKFKLNLQPARQKFYGVLNGIFGRVGTKTSPTCCYL